MTWEEPPPPRGHIWRTALVEVAERPGEWAKFGPYTPDSIGKIQSNVRHHGVRLGFDMETTTRRVAHEAFLYVRCVGDDPEVAPVSPMGSE